MAIEIERRLSEKRKLKADATASFNASSAHVSMNSDKTLVTGANERSPSNYDTSAAVESITEDSSRTIEGEITENGESNAENSFMKKFGMLNIDGIKPLTLNVDVITQLDIPSEYLSPSFSLHSSPSLGALNDSKNQSLYFTPMSGRETISPIHDDFRPGRLIRSNSYTLEKPSPMLLQHMEANGISVDKTKNMSSGLAGAVLVDKQKLNKLNYSLSSSTPRKQIKTSMFNETNGRESKSRLPKTSSTIYSRKSISPVRNTVPTKELSLKVSVTKRKSPQPVVFKNTESILRSVYAPVINSVKKAESLKKHLNGSKSFNTSVRTKSKSPADSSQQSVPDPNQYQNILKLIEEQHTAQMNALIQRQKEEQQRIQEEFQRQQESLLKEITEMVIQKKGIAGNDSHNQSIAKNIMNLSKANIHTPNDNDSMFSASFDSNGNRIPRKTPDSSKCIRRLDYDDFKQFADESKSLYSLNNSNHNHSTHTEQEIKAATTIVAYARGYLTRRLFKTRKVEDVVKTIRDTLNFILDIHFENNTIETPADIELKTHLIQQVIVCQK